LFFISYLKVQVSAPVLAATAGSVQISRYLLLWYKKFLTIYKFL